jgi:hypothetical protein
VAQRKTARGRAPENKSFLLLFFKKEALSYRRSCRPILGIKKESSSFLKKRSKRLLFLAPVAPTYVKYVARVSLPRAATIEYED